MKGLGLDYEAIRAIKPDIIFCAAYVRLIGFPINSSEPMTSLRRLPPNLGEHSRDILKELGISEEQIDAMVQDRSLICNDRARPSHRL